MKIALVVAGGVGARTGQKVPKQFLTVYDTPVIIYTLDNIQSSELFDEIYVVCAKEWTDFVVSYAMQYNISDFKGTILSGDTRFDSMKNGIEFLNEKYLKEDIVCVIDGNRPLIPHKVFDNCLKGLENADCVIAFENCYDSMYCIEDKETMRIGNTDRSKLIIGQSPEILRLDFAYHLFQLAKKDGKTGFPIAAMAIEYGSKVNFIQGSSKSIKITTLDDFAIFKALIGEKKIKPLIEKDV